MDLITRDPGLVSGTPCFAGTRVPVRSLFDWLARDYTLAEFLENFPSVSREQAEAVILLACEKLDLPAFPGPPRVIAQSA